MAVTSAGTSNEALTETVMVLELCRGGSLAGAVRRGKLPRGCPDGGPVPDAVLRTLLDVAMGVAYLHDSGIVSREVEGI